MGSHRYPGTLGLLLLLLSLTSLAIPAHAAPTKLMAELVARRFFKGLVEGNGEVVASLCADRFDFDGHRLTGADEIRTRLDDLIVRARSRTLRVRELRLLSWSEMVKHFGTPPERMRRVVGPGDMFALARFDQLGAVAILERRGRFWRVKALTD